MIAAALLGLTAASATVGHAPDEPSSPFPPATTFAAAGDDAGQDLFLMAEGRPYRVRLRVLIGDRPLRAAWLDAVRDTHARLDIDHDGKLTIGEAEANGIGLLSRPGVGNLAPADADRDKDGTIAVAELAEALGGVGGAVLLQAEGVPDRATDALFDVLDRDKDGQISRSELATAGGTLRGLDRDDNELIATAEVAGGPPGMTRTGAGTGPGRPPRDVGVPPVVTLANGESPLRLARLLMKKYDLKSARGQARPDARLAPDEFTMPPASFAALDANRDGLLSADELRKYLAVGPPDATLDVVFPVGQDGVARAVFRVGEAEVPAGFAIRQVAAGSIEVEVGLYRLEIQVDAGQGLAEAVRRNMQALFRAADSGEDGYLDAAELTPDDGQTIASPLASLLKPLDRDGDGKLFPADLDEYVTRSVAEARGRLNLVAVDEGRALFGLLDRNGDRQLGTREVLDASSRVLACDRDRDGRVGAEEVPHHVQLTLTRGDIAGILAPPAGTPNGVVVITPARVTTAGPARPAPLVGPEWFRRMDRNRDGDVSRREFLGPIAQFDRLDRDGDGLLGAAEAETATPPVKGPGG